MSDPNGDPKKPHIGAMSIDASDLTPTPLTPDQVQQRIKVRAGFNGAVACLALLSAEQIQLGGLNGDDVKRALEHKLQFDRCDEFLPAAEKLVELLRDTKVEHGHQIGMILSEIAAQARRRAERDPKAAEVLGVISDLLEYVSAPALKAAATRAKREEAENNGQPAKEPAKEAAKEAAKEPAKEPAKDQEAPAAPAA